MAKSLKYWPHMHWDRRSDPWHFHIKNARVCDLSTGDSEVGEYLKLMGQSV